MPALALLAVLVPLAPRHAAANDRLPRALGHAYAVSSRHVNEYLRFIIRRVWRPRLNKFKKSAPPKLRSLANETTDEIVELVLPHARRLVEDGIHGTRHTHLSLTHPRLWKAASGWRSTEATPAAVMGLVLDQRLRTHTAAIGDRLEQALAEDLEDAAQREVEEALGLPAWGRPRAVARPLPARWEARYAAVRPKVHAFAMYWLRKKARLQLMNHALTMSPREIDRSRHTGVTWGLMSAISSEAWAQNRLKIDFRWGRHNWRILRRRIRRRMDQDQALAAWALTRLVKELHAPRTSRAIAKALEEGVRSALSRPQLGRLAGRYPVTARELESRLRPVAERLRPILDQAMDRVPLPPGIRDLAREHGRRYVLDDIGSDLFRAVARESAPFVAARRVRRRLGAWISTALASFDPGAAAGDSHRRVLKHVRKEVAPRVAREIDGVLDEVAGDTRPSERDARRTEVREVVQRFRLDRLIERATRRELNR